MLLWGGGGGVRAIFFFQHLTFLRRAVKIMDRWMTCDFTSFSTVFQSYQDDFWMIMKGLVQWNVVTVGKISPRVRIELGPLAQWASAKPTELPGS